MSVTYDRSVVFYCYRKSMSVTCDRSVVFSWYFVFLHKNKIDCRNITEILWKMETNTHKQTKKFDIMEKVVFYSCPWSGVFHTTSCDQVCQRLATGQCFSPPIKLTTTI